MPIYERGNRFLVSVGSKQDRLRASVRTREEAERVELELLLKRKQQATPEAPKGSTKTLQDAYDLTFRLHWKGEKAEKTNQINAGAILKSLGADTLLTDITAEDITETILEFEEQGNSGSTVNKKASCYSMMMRTAEEQGWITKWPKPPRRKESKHRIRWMDTAEETKALVLCDHLGLTDLKDYIVLAVDTGFRRGELLPFQPRDFSSGLLHLHAGETKNDDARAVPATRRVTEVIQRRSSLPYVCAPLTVHTLRAQWEILKEHMGLGDDPQFIVHMLRHTCASRLVQRGVPLKMVQTWMGHKNINTTLRYAHLAPDSLMGAKEALEVDVAVQVEVTHSMQPEMAHDF